MLTIGETVVRQRESWHLGQGSSLSLEGYMAFRRAVMCGCAAAGRRSPCNSGVPDLLPTQPTQTHVLVLHPGHMPLVLA